jgi:alanine-glyoxylate transaminase / serine-glyoxylate transaminase / serine-pyruvate transaminase
MSSLSIQPPKRLLFGPGPTMVEPRVYEALSQPIVGHLDPYFFEVVDRVRASLKRAFGTANEFTIAISGTGSAGMEAAIGNFVEPDSKFAVFMNGFFCDRLAEMGRRQGAEVARCNKPWGQTFSEEEAREFLLRERPQVVAFVHAETSTGALQPPEAITRPAREIDALVIADTVTSLGGIPINVDAVGIDIAFSCTQKGLSCPPGLAPLTVSPRALERLAARKTPVREWYLDLNLLRRYLDGERRYHHTAPISLFYALCEGLKVIEDEGLENRFARHVRNHRTLVAGLEQMGMSMHVAEDRRIPTLNTPRVPAGVDDVAVRKRLLERYNIDIAGGFGPLAGKIFRIGLMGPLSTESSVATLLDALCNSLR